MSTPSDITKIDAMAAIIPIHFASQQFIFRRNIKQGLDKALEKVAGTRDFTLAFRQCYPLVWSDLLAGINASDDEFVAALEEDGNSSEPIVQREITERQRKAMRIGLILSLSTNDPIWSKPITDTSRELRKEGTETNQLVHETRWLEVLLSKDCEARNIFLKYVDAHQLIEVLKSISPSLDMPDSGVKMRETVADGTAAAGFPQTAETISKDLGPPRKLKPSEYEIIQWPKDEELNLSPSQAEFDTHIERWVDEARAEAVHWRAPKVLFDHLFLRLLRDGTDTAQFLNRKGVHRLLWSEEIRDSLVNGSQLIENPRLSKEIGDSIPDDDVKIDLLEAMGASKAAGLSEDEEHVLTWDLYYRSSIERTFTDLMWLEKEPFKHSSHAWHLLKSAGISEDIVKLEVQQMKGYPDPVVPTIEKP